MPPKISEAEVSARWDGNADLWTAHVREGRDGARDNWNNPAFLEFVGDLAGRKVLDAGCGEGYNTRIFARCGAHMTGIDISARMLEHARAEESREPLGIRYENASYCDLSIFPEASFDAAISTMALMDGPDFPRAISEIARVVRPGGIVAYSILHPCFVTKGFGWVYDDQGKAIKFTGADYFNDESWVEHWAFSNAPDSTEVQLFAVPRFDRTLSHYINGTIAAGLRLAAISEPRLPESVCEKFPNYRKLHDHVALFLHVRAIKP
jgi:SAM-dependent methyltransferase